MEIKTIKATIIRTNNYLVINGKTRVLIDCSLTLEDLEKALEGKKLDAILLTHGHWDHFLTLEKIGNTFSVPIYCTKECCKKIMESKNDVLRIAKKVDIDVKSLNFNFIHNNDILNFPDLSFKVLSTRGHTDCGVCYLVENHLFTGDTLFRTTVGRTDLPTSNLDSLLLSLKKLAKLNDNTIVLPGHGSTTTIGNEQAMISQLTASSKDLGEDDE